MPDRPHHAFGTTDALLLLMAAVWGVNYSAVKYGSIALTPLTFTWLRILGAMLTLFVVATLQRHRWPARRDVLRLMALGVLGTGIYQLCFVFGVSRTRVADAALIVASAPAFIAVMSWFRGVEQLHARAVAGVVLSIVGVGIVMFGSASVPHTHGSVLGASIVFLAVLCWSTFTVMVQPFTLRVNPVQLNALTMAGGMLPLLCLTPWAFASAPRGPVPPVAWGCLVYSSVISIGIGYLFWFRGVRVLGPTRTSAYGNLQPVVAILVGWIALHEAPTAWQLVGATTIVSGIVLTRL